MKATVLAVFLLGLADAAPVLLNVTECESSFQNVFCVGSSALENNSPAMSAMNAIKA